VDNLPGEPTETAAQALQVELGCVDELVSALAPAGWELDFCQLDRGPGAIALSALSGHKVSLLGLEFEASTRQNTMPPAGQISFGLPSRPQQCGTIGRRRLYSESLTAICGESGMEVSSRAGFGVYTLSFEEASLLKVAQRSGVPDPRQTFGRGCFQRKPDPAALDALRGQIGQYLHIPVTTDMSAAQGAALLSEMENELPSAVMDLWFSGLPMKYVPLCNRSRAVKRALEYIEANFHRIITIEELCQCSAASISTLERGFKERFGLPPKRYLLASRLGGARRALLCPEDERTIADIAADWGFWHMSKFAADYRQMFGETPSTSLARGQLGI